MPHRPEQLLTLKEAASRLRVGRTTMGELVRTGSIPAIRFPNAPQIVRVRERDLEAFIERGGGAS